MVWPRDMRTFEGGGGGESKIHRVISDPSLWMQQMAHKIARLGLGIWKERQV